MYIFARQTHDNPSEDSYRSEDPLHQLEEADEEVGIESVEAERNMLAMLIFEMSYVPSHPMICSSSAHIIAGMMLSMPRGKGFIRLSGGGRSTLGS